MSCQQAVKIFIADIDTWVTRSQKLHWPLGVESARSNLLGALRLRGSAEDADEDAQLRLGQATEQGRAPWGTEGLLGWWDDPWKLIFDEWFTCGL